jgi:hypothetical protein
MNINRGSYRIWVNDICGLLVKNSDINAKIVNDINMIDELCDVIILGKSCYRSVDNVRKLHPKKIIGAINVDSDYKNKNIDFVIVGSIEEYTSLSFYKDVFIVELIEQKFMNTTIKKHFEKDNIVIGYHGHHPHLFKFFPFLKSALERVNKDVQINLKVIIGDKNFKWVHGKPDIDNIEILYYDEINLSETIKTFDIGVVPNVLDMRIFENFNQQFANVKNLELGLNTTDYFLRFKNKTNPGRAYVFYQHGIPVIHDLSPSSYSFMQEAGLYSCAHDDASWEKEIRNFLNVETRRKHAKVFHDIFHKKFTSENRIDNFVKNIKSIIR